MEAALAALKGGISVLEVMMSTPDAPMVIRGLLQENPFSIIGAGSVLNVDDAREAMNAGAMFLMSPSTIMEILHEVEGSGVLYVPGVMTPTEVLSAYEAGAKLVKVYPATILGGSKYLSALKKPFPQIPMVASQGISIDSIKQYMDVGTSAVVLSDAIFDKNAMKQRDFDSIGGFGRLKSCPSWNLAQKIKQVIYKSLYVKSAIKALFGTAVLLLIEEAADLKNS